MRGVVWCPRGICRETGTIVLLIMGLLCPVDSMMVPEQESESGIVFVCRVGR